MAALSPLVGLAQDPEPEAAEEVAYITGIVVTPAGDPVEGVTVELWSASRRLTARLSDRNGRFRFDAYLAPEAAGFYVGRMGYRSLQVPFQAGRMDYRITMPEEAISLQGFVVEADSDICAYDEEDLARELWEALGERYNNAVDSVGIATYLAKAEIVVPIGQVGPVELPEFAPSQRGSNSLLRFSWKRYINKSGYARPVRRTDLEGSYDSWAYPPLDADFSPHFADELFGELHRFRVEDSDPSGWTLIYCAERRKDDRAWLKGRLRIAAADTTLQWAEWAFVTREPNEGAGGRAVFPQISDRRETTFLLPTEGLFYRRRKEQEFVQEYQRFEEWIVSAGDSVPFLPLREAVPDSARSGVEVPGPPPDSVPPDSSGTRVGGG